MGSLLWLIIVILIISWILGLSFSFGGGLIHLLVVLAVILVIFNIFFGYGPGPWY